MKRYTSRATKVLAVVVLICVAVVLIGIILAFTGAKNMGLPFGFILLGGLLGVIFLACFLAEKSRALIIDTDKIIFPRGAERNGKTVFQKTVVRICDLSSVESRFHKGDKIISDEGLNKEETYNFIQRSFEQGRVETNGTEVSNILPPMNMFTPTNDRQEKKNNNNDPNKKSRSIFAETITQVYNNHFEE